MSIDTFDYQGWAQVVLAIAAILIAPTTISALYVKIFHNVQAISTPVPPLTGRLSKLWDIGLRNRSRFFGNFTIFLFPRSVGNRVVSFVQTSGNDGAMVVSPALVEGALEISVTRFAKRRLLKLRVEFSGPDAPSFDSSELRIVVKTRSLKHVGESTQLALALTYQRLMLVMLAFFGVTTMIIATLLYGAFTNG